MKFRRKNLPMLRTFKTWAIGAGWACCLTGSWAADDQTVGSSLFTEVSRAVGVEFTHFNGMSNEWYMVEGLGAGAALFDYDNDGDLDLYLVQGNLLGAGKTAEDAVFPPKRPLPLRDRLFRNDLNEGSDGIMRPRFVDVTRSCGIVAEGYGMGVAAADFDNDGWVDLYVTNFGPNQMWRNQGDGTFVEVTEKSRSGDDRWSVSAAFLDYDRDGWLDLFIPNYVLWEFADHRHCLTKTGRKDYCGPSAFPDAPDRLLRNRGDGSFEDVTVRAGLHTSFGSGLGVVTSDFNGDGWPDIYVANDADANLLWLNQKNGTFVNDALLGGCALNADGAPEASMGVDAADFDGDGDEDLFMTHLGGETHTLYINDGSALFDDKTFKAGLGNVSREATGFGTAWFDYDNDGLLDLLVVNGAVMIIEALAAKGDPFPLRQSNQLFQNTGEGRFREVTHLGGKAFAESAVSRGAAFGDLDNDGDVDVVITNNSGPVRLLLNRVGSDQTWLGIRAVDRLGRRDMLGARLCLTRKNGKPLWRRVRSDASYACANDPRVVFGLKRDSRPVNIAVYWPDGSLEHWPISALNRYHTLVQGRGKAHE